MTPLMRELTPPGSRDYEILARKRLLEMTQKEQILYIDFLPIFQKGIDITTLPQELSSENVFSIQELYRGHIHLSIRGNRLVSRWIARSL
jgi:lysophospholipase L1-like esterase